jgi:hypothetical protein
MIEWYISERQEGKTEHLIEWVKQADKIRSYPFWNRIVLVSSIQEAIYFRRQLLTRQEWDSSPDGLEYNMVYHLDDWNDMYSIREPVQIAIDNVEFFLNRLLFNTGGILVRATATGKVLEVPRHV